MNETVPLPRPPACTWALTTYSLPSANSKTNDRFKTKNSSRIGKYQNLIVWQRPKLTKNHLVQWHDSFEHWHHIFPSIVLIDIPLNCVWRLWKMKKKHKFGNQHKYCFFCSLHEYLIDEQEHLQFSKNYENFHNYKQIETFINQKNVFFFTLV